MSRTIRRLPTGARSKKNRVIGYYNHVYSFPPSAIHLLKTPMKPQHRASRVERHGLWLHAPDKYNTVWTYADHAPYTVDEPRPHKISFAGPKWVDTERYEERWVQDLIASGWTHANRTKRKQRGPEDWDYDNIILGPDFRKQMVWMENPDYDEELREAYLAWINVHRIVIRNGHYKDHHPGYAKFHRREKQRLHQLDRSRQKADLRKLVDEALMED